MSHHQDTGTEPDPDGANILLQTPPMASNTDQVCARLLAEGDEPPDTCLWITYTRSPDEKLAAWRTHGGSSFPQKLGVIVVGDQTRAAAASSSNTNIPTQPASPVLTTVADPTDLTGQSIEVSKFFEAWGVAEGQFSICLDSLTPLLVYVSVDRAYRFLHTLTTRVASLGATAHYHLNPNAHDEETVRRLTSLFDDVVECADTDTPTPSNLGQD